jgi:hypothetical protein
MDDSLTKETQDQKLQECIRDNDAVIDESDEERTAAFEEDSAEIKEIFLDSDSEECFSSTEGSSFGEEASSVEEDCESEKEEENLQPIRNENGQI